MERKYCFWPPDDSVACRNAFASRILRVLLIVVSSSALAGVAVAADRFEVDDEVEVFFLNRWFPGKVFNVDARGRVGAEFQFAGGLKRGGFLPNQVRMKCEIQALGPVREWRDASGQFRIRAALVRYSGEKITLRKIDMEEISLAASALGKSDQRYLAKLKKELPAGAKGSVGLAAVEKFAGSPEKSRSRDTPFGQGMGSVPSATQRQEMFHQGAGRKPIGGGMDLNKLGKVFGKTGGFEAIPPAAAGKPGSTLFGGKPSGVFAADHVGRRALTPDPAPAHLAFSQGGAGFPSGSMFAKIGAVLPVGGSDGWVLASVEDRRAGGSESHTRLVWVSVARRKIEKTQTLPLSDIVLDYHPPSHRLLTCSRPELGPGDGTIVLSIWEVLPTDDAPQSIVRWVAPQARHVSGESPWARIVDGNVVIQRVGDHQYIGWDQAGKSIRYRIYQEALFTPKPTFSGTRKYFVLPEDGQVRVFDAASGKNVSTLSVEPRANAVAVSNDGRRLAVLQGGSMSVWDLTDAQSEPEHLQAEAIGAGSDLTMEWLDDRHLMIDRGPIGMLLFGLEHGVTLWSYRFDADVASGMDAMRSRDIVGDQLVYSAGFHQGTQIGLAVGAVKLPGADAEQAAANLDPDTLMLMRPGSSIRIEVKAGKHNDQVRVSLERQVKDNGWILAPNASNLLIAEIKQGETQEVTYGFHGRRANETASVTPYMHSVSIVCENEKAWEQSVNVGLSSIVSIREDETIQSKIDQTEKVDPQFFDRIEIPERVFDPKKRQGLGTSVVTSRGLVKARGKP